MPPSAVSADLVARLDAGLPQTQCTRCGYPRCRAYAEALAVSRADIDQCPPGGEPTIQALAGLLGRAPKPPNPAFGMHGPRTRAVIDETRCIGCRKCLDVCPVDAILGARKLMNTVIARECTGCGLCLPPCPVDCIALAPVAPPADAGPWPEYAHSETERWARAPRHGLRAWRAGAARRRGSIFPPSEVIRQDIRAALKRAKQKRNRQDLQD